MMERIQKKTFGTPRNTNAVVLSLPESPDLLPDLTVSREGEKILLTVDLAENEIIFGLGETVRGMNKRGFIYRSWNSDEPCHQETAASLYASHNLVVFFRPDRLFGLYLDDPGLVTWDLGATERSRAVITSENGHFTLYCLSADSLPSLARSFRRLTGRSYLPPKWAFGYIQSRWGYAGEEEIRSVVREHRNRRIPLDSVCLDIDYMQAFRNFTWRRDTFPDLPSFTAAMKQEHIHLIPIIDAGIPQSEDDPSYRSGHQEDVFCRMEDGSEFVASVWPGWCVFPDFLRADARRWFGDQYRSLLEAGVEGFWNDMNEPALFFSLSGLEAAYRKLEDMRGRQLLLDDFWKLSSAVNDVKNSPSDYRSFWHRPDGEAPVRHDRVHNLYGAGMTRATAEGLRRYDPDRRFLLFSRSSFIGAHRDGGVWMGDNYSWWSHILLALQMLPSLNLCGFLYCGCDLGGFGKDTTEDLLERFLQLGVFMPLMRNHSALHTRQQEIFRFSIWRLMRDTLTVRYALLPFLYSEFMQAALSDGMLFRPLAFDYPEDSRAVHCEDQLMWGRSCMVAPVYTPNAEGRYVYLPEDMLLIRFRSREDYDTVPLAAGDHYISLSLGEFPLFVRKGCAVLLCGGGENVDELDESRFLPVGWSESETVCDLYRDDGETVSPDLESHMISVRIPPLCGVGSWIGLPCE